MKLMSFWFFATEVRTRWCLFFNNFYEKMSRLKDPLGNRVVKEAPLPYYTSLCYDQVIKDHLIDEKLLENFF